MHLFSLVSHSYIAREQTTQLQSLYTTSQKVIFGREAGHFYHKLISLLEQEGERFGSLAVITQLSAMR